jgi:hypothetical protein
MSALREIDAVILYARGEQMIFIHGELRQNANVVS